MWAAAAAATTSAALMLLQLKHLTTPNNLHWIDDQWKEANEWKEKRWNNWNNIVSILHKLIARPRRIEWKKSRKSEYDWPMRGKMAIAKIKRRKNQPKQNEKQQNKR